jgi:hypothetical protein
VRAAGQFGNMHVPLRFAENIAARLRCPFQRALVGTITSTPTMPTARSGWSWYPGVCAFFVVMVSVWTSLPAYADASDSDDSRAHFSLSWARLREAESCISAVELARGVEARLGRPVFGALAQTDVAIEGSIWRGQSDARFHALLSVVDEGGRRTGFRELVDDGPNCRDLDEAIVLALSLMIDPKAAFTAESVPPAAKRTPDRARKPDAGARQRAGSGWAGSSAFGYGLFFGVLPRVAHGIWLRVSLEPPGVWPVHLWASYLPSQITTITDTTSVAFSRASLGLATCPLSAHGARLGYALCAGAEAGSLASAGVGRSGLVDQRRLIVDAMLGGQVDLALTSHVSAMLASGALLHFYRDTFEYRSNDGTSSEVFRAPLLGAMGGIGILFRLP